MADFTDILRSYDRKERAWLVRNALGAPKLDAKFAAAVTDALALDPPLSINAWWSIDYHLDWLVASVQLFRAGQLPREVLSQPMPNNGAFTNTIEDVDLIIVDHDRLILVEAKAFGGWANKQMNSKMKRLALMSGEARISPPDGATSIELYFVLTSLEKSPSRVKTDNWPSWAKRGGKLAWIELETTLVGVVYRTAGYSELNQKHGYFSHWTTESDAVRKSSGSLVASNPLAEQPT